MHWLLQPSFEIYIPLCQWIGKKQLFGAKALKVVPETRPMTAFSWRCWLWRCQSDRRAYRNPPCSCWRCERPLMVHWWPLFAGQVWPGRSSATTKEGRWWEAGGGGHFSPFLSGFLGVFPFPFSVLSVLLAAEIGVYKMSQSSHRAGLEWGSKESVRTPCADFWVPGCVGCPAPGAEGWQPQPCPLRGWLGTQSCFHPSWLRWGAGESRRCPCQLEVIGTYSTFHFQAPTPLTLT